MSGSGSAEKKRRGRVKKESAGTGAVPIVGLPMVQKEGCPSLPLLQKESLYKVVNLRKGTPTFLVSIPCKKK